MLLFYGIRISKVTGRRITKVLTAETTFAIEGEKSIFDGLEISKDTKLCEAYMGKYPVISISLKESMLLLMRMHLILQFRLCKEQRKNSSFYQIVNT